MKQNILKRQAEAMIPSEWGNFNVIAYAASETEKMPHLALVSEHFDPSLIIPVRIHSECMTGDIFHSKRCDCGEQLATALKTANERGGVVVYLRQEGRGIGLINKLKAYQLQDHGYNTAEANIHLGFEADGRSYKDAIAILADLHIRRIHLMTNNPDKIQQLELGGIEILSRIPMIIEPKSENKFYLHTKQDVMGHMLNF